MTMDKRVIEIWTGWVDRKNGLEQTNGIFRAFGTTTLEDSKDYLINISNSIGQSAIGWVGS
jgi:hypothetical protein